MEHEIARLLGETQSPLESQRKNAELQLKNLWPNDAFPIALIDIGSQEQFPLNLRQAALLYLKTFVQSVWSPSFDEFKGHVLVSADERQRTRHLLLELATSEGQDRKVKSAASTVVSKIATADFPDEWPDLLPTILHVVSNGSDGQRHGALKVLQDLVEDCFNEEQFFKVARDLIQAIYVVAASDSVKPILRALAVAVLAACFNILEMIMEDHKAVVKGFVEETVSQWNPFFLAILRAPVPQAPSEDDDDADDDKQAGAASNHRGVVALKLQVVKVLMKIRSVFPAALTATSQQLFSATWDELTAVQPMYEQMYITDDRQGRLEDADGLPYTLDWLVLEELDFMQACLRAPPVRKELEQQLQQQQSPATWVTEVIKLAIAYSQITNEEEGLWDIDVNVFVSEEANVTAQYTTRAACGDLIVRLGEWQSAAAIEGLLHHARALYAGDCSWKTKEAALYVLNQLLGDMSDIDKRVHDEAAAGFLDLIRYAMSQAEMHDHGDGAEDVYKFLRARGYVVAGTLTRTSGEALLHVAGSLLESSLHAISHDPSELVRVSCIRALQSYLAVLPPAATLPMQPAILSSISAYLFNNPNQDLTSMDENEDIMIAVVETLRDAILLDTQICLNTSPSGLDVVFAVAKYGAANFQLTMLLTETFEEIAQTLASAGPEFYSALCGKVLPELSGFFDLASIAEENALTNLAAEMLSVLAENGTTPLPQGFVAATMPKLNRLLLESKDEELIKSATAAVKYMLEKDPEQLFSWQSADGKAGLEVILVIIAHLLSPMVDDNAAAEVGGLAAALVEKAGAEKLGPYLTQLLEAVAVRLGTAEQAQFIQSLIIVFARLSLISASEVVNFLSQLQVSGENGLQVVMSKWLENSVNFAGYDEIRQNVIALSSIYNLNDPRISQIQVKGDLVINPAQSGRIMTRSRARQTPDQYTIVPASLKIIKVLIDELLSASGGPDPTSQNGGTSAAAGGDADGDDASDDDDSWEDEPGGFLDLGTGMTKEQLMAYAADDAPERRRDDETQAYILQFFREQAQRPEFGDVFGALTPAEQDKLRSMSG